MNWYYAENGTQTGPVSDAELEALRRSGRVQHDTLVWREGLPEWQPYHQAVSVGQPSAIAAALPGGGRLDLQPMGIGDILDRTFRLYRANFLSFFLVMLVVQVILFLLGLAWQFTALPHLQGRLPSGYHISFVQGLSTLVGTILLIAVNLVLSQIAIGALTIAISAAFLGQPTDMRSAVKAMRGKVGALLAATILSSILIGLGLMVCIIPGVWLALSWLLVSEVVVLEGLKPWAALERSRELMRVKTDKGLVRNNVTKASVIILIMFILGAVAGAIVTIPLIIMAVIQGASHQAVGHFGIFQIVQGLLTSVVHAAVAPIGVVAMILFYYDIRIRKEGFDLEVLAAAMGGRQRPS